MVSTVCRCCPTPPALLPFPPKRFVLSPSSLSIFSRVISTHPPGFSLIDARLSIALCLVYGSHDQVQHAPPAPPISPLDYIALITINPATIHETHSVIYRYCYRCNHSNCYSAPPTPQLPFYHTFVNCVWFGLWLGILYTVTLSCVLVFGSTENGERTHSFTRVRKSCTATA